jgi:hypothetical protein
MRDDMNGILKKFAITSVVLINACSPKLTASNSANGDQTNSPPPAAMPQNTPTAPQQLGRSPSRLKNGYVPDEQTAISIAVAVWIPIYGKELIESEKPYKATLEDGVWTVTGSLPEGYNGGTAIADISQESGCILRVIHEQ